MTEDISSFYPDFGVSATVNGVACTGIFDDAYQDALGMSGSQPVLLVPSAVAAAYGQAVVVNSASYTIAAIQPDGTGITRLVLEEA